MNSSLECDTDEGLALCLAWGVKASLRRYVSANGTVSYGQPAMWVDGAFQFPIRGQRRGTDSAVQYLECYGDVLFQAHGGLLSVAMAEPWLELSGPDSVLSVVASTKERVPQRLSIAQLSLVESPEDDLSERNPVEFQARLTAAGTSLLGGFYATGTELDPVRVMHMPV